MAVMYLPSASADEAGTMILVQTDRIPEEYESRIISSYDPDDDEPVWMLEAENESDTEMILNAFSTETAELNAIIHRTETSGESIPQTTDPLSRLNSLVQEETLTADIAYIGSGTQLNHTAQVSFTDTDTADDPQLNALISENENVLGIAAFDENGNSDVSILYASLMYAVKAGVKGIILPVDQEVIRSHPLLDHAVQYAENHSITVYESAQEYRSQNPERTSEISVFEARLQSGAVYDSQTDEYIWFPETSVQGQRFTYRISYSLNGIYERSAGTVHIRLPKHILHTRDDETGDDCELSVLSEENAGENDQFAYRVTDDFIEIFNINEISAASEGFFEISYVTNEETFAYRDGDESDVFAAQLIVDNGSETETARCEAESFRVDTSSKILSVSKRPPEKSSVWNDLWMDGVEGHEDEEYLIWEIHSYIRDNATQPYTLSFDDVISSDKTQTRVVGYRYCDTMKFVPESSVSDQTIDQARTDYVLTAHKKCDADEFDITNQITVTLTPQDGLDESSSAASQAVYTEQKKSFIEPTGSIGSEKFASDTSWGLDLLQENKTDALSGLEYHIIMEGYPYQWTREEGDDPLDPSSYGRKNILYRLIDDDLRINNEENRLNPEDYTIDSVQYVFDFSDALFDEDAQAFVPCEVSYEPHDTITLYGLFADGWKQVAVKSLFTDSMNLNEELAEYDNDRFVFRQPCHGIRIEAENSHYHTRAMADLSVSLNNTPHVQSLIRDLDRIALNNTEVFSVNNDAGEIASLTRQASQMIRREYRDSDLKKRVIASYNDIASKQYTITWKVRLNEWISGREGLHRPYTQNGGTFYDLLPAGSDIDPSSVSVWNETGELSEGQYEISLSDNFRGSGRTLLTARINEPGEEYSLVYDTHHSWESIRDFGRGLLNPVAYETGNADIADGFMDDGTGLSDINKSCLSSLDHSCHSDRFIYTEQPHEITAITSAVAGLKKKVKGNSSFYSYEDSTSPDGRYSYRLRYETSDDSRADHMIFFDSLENCHTNNMQSAWHGTLESIDVSQLVSKGINPEIYVSTIPDLDIEAHHDLSDTSVWSDDLSDLSEVKAIAIDMSLDENGNDYVLGSSESVSAVLWFRAPHTVSLDLSDNKAFNNVWLSCDLHGSFNEEENYLIRQDYTAIAYVVKADIPVCKKDRDNPETTIPGIAFELSGTSAYGQSITETKTTGINGTLTFRNIPAGTYQLKETGWNPDWLTDQTVHEVLIAMDGTLTIDGNECTGDALIITDARRIHKDFSFEKRDLIHQEKPVSNAQYRLSGTSLYGNETVLYASSDMQGTVLFKDLEPGTYTIHETDAPQGYLKDNTEYTLILDESGDFHMQETEPDDSGKYILFNEPLHELKLIKKNAYDNSLIPGAKFYLKGIADDGTETAMTAASNQRGIVQFTSLHAGTYSLQETEAPEGFIKDPAIHAVRINHDGSVECDELEQNELGIPVIYNQPEMNQTIRIIKRWMDDGSEERPIPVIHLTNTKPQPVQKITTIDIDRWLDEDTGLAYISDGAWFEENTDLTKEEVLAREDIIRVDDEQTDYSMYIWPNEDGYEWWSDADVIELPEDCSGMFAECSDLETLDLSRFSSDHVTDMYSMFSNCFALSELDISHFNTVNVTDMSYMFHYCKGLTSLNLSGIDTSNIENMSSMFSYCLMLSSLDLSCFDTHRVERMDATFAYDSLLTAIYVSDLWSTESVYSGRDMFKNCKKLPGYNKSKVDSTYAHYGEGGYLTYRAYETAGTNQSDSLSGLITTVHAGEQQEYVSDSSSFITSSMSDEEKRMIMNSPQGYWQIMDGNKWVYTFPVVNDQDEFWFYEDEMEGWTTNADIYYPGSVHKQSGTIINFKGINPETGEMIITKEVVNDNSDNTKFNFNITLRNEKGEPLHGRNVFGDTAFENGRATVSIASGGTYRITGIPIGWLYLVEEEANENYSVTSVGASGVIMGEQTTVHFINTKKETYDQTVNLRLTKRLSGRYEDMEEEEFIFHFFLGGLKPSTQYELSTGQIYFSDEAGGADFSCHLKEDEDITLLNLPKGATYQVCEEGGDYLSSYEISTEGDEELISKQKTSETRDHFLSTALETAGESDVQITFTNQFEYVQNITVQKMCTYESDSEFEFTAHFSGLEERDVIDTGFGSLKPDADGNIIKTFFLKNGESVDFRNIPVGVNYVFTEEPCPWSAEYRIEDRYGRGKVVKQFGTNTVSNMALSTKEETVNQFEDVLITFTNTPEPVSLSVTKKVKGNMGSKNESFVFMITLSDNGSFINEAEYQITENGTLKKADTLQMNAEGKAVFELKDMETIVFSNLNPGTRYTIEEQVDASEGYRCEVVHGNEHREGYFIAGSLSGNDAENSFTFINERNAVIPTGRKNLFRSTAFFLMAVLVMIIRRLSA